MKEVRTVFVLFSIATIILVSGCSDENPSPFGKVNLAISSSDNIFQNSGGRIHAGDIVIDDFQISIRDVIFMTDNDDAGVADDSTEIGFRGPFQLDLLNGADAITQTIGSIEVPNGSYEQLRFKFHKDEDLSPSEPLYDKSIFIAGTINDVPFELWHDTSENFDVGKDKGIVVSENEVNLIVNFSISQFMNSMNEIDLSTAKDGNQDGLIEINTNDPDGNKEIADLIKENIKFSADLIKL